MKIDLVLLSLRSKKGTLTLELPSHCLGRAFCSPAHAGEGAMPALLWWKATMRGAGSVIYLEIGFGSSAAVTARVTAAQPAASPATSPTLGLLRSSGSGCSLSSSNGSGLCGSVGRAVFIQCSNNTSLDVKFEILFLIF